MGDTAINVPLQVRIHELQQLHSMIQQAIESYETADLDEYADKIRRVYDEHVENVTADYPESEAFAAWVSMPAEDWRQVMRALSRARHDAGETRTRWLQTKLVGRLEERSKEL